MSGRDTYRIETTPCPAHPGYYRWTVYEGDRPLDLPGYAYASAWSASEAARVALHWHLVLTPLRTQADTAAPSAPGPVATDPKRAAA